MPFEIAADFVLADVVAAGATDAAVGFAASDLGAAAFADTAFGVGEYAAGATAADVGGGFAAEGALADATMGTLASSEIGAGVPAAFNWAGLAGKALTSGATALGTGVVQAALSPSLKPMQMQPPAAVAPPQPAQAPSAQAMRQQAGAAVAGQGQDSTLLTGLQGVSTDKYNLGRNTLLGS